MIPSLGFGRVADELRAVSCVCLVLPRSEDLVNYKSIDFFFNKIDFIFNKIMKLVSPVSS